MRYVLRDILACFITLALVFNGAGFGFLSTPASAKLVNADVSGAFLTDKHHHEDTRQFPNHDTHIHAGLLGPDNSPASEHPHNGAKCCTMCVAFGNLLPAAALTQTQFEYHAIVFNVRRQHLAGHTVALDPDIPKAIV